MKHSGVINRKMDNWINQIYIGLMTGILGGIASGYIIYKYFSEGFTIKIVLEVIILTAVVGLLSIVLYILLFERKKEEEIK